MIEVQIHLLVETEEQAEELARYADHTLSEIHPSGRWAPWIPGAVLSDVVAFRIRRGGERKRLY